MKSITDITRRAWHGAHMHLWLYHRAPVIQRRRVQMVQRRGYARVVFLAMNVPMWKYQRLYQAMLGHPLFRPTIVLSPSVAYVHAQQQADMKALRDYFDARGTTYIDWDSAAPCDIGGELDPDIIFYPQPYEHLLVPQPLRPPAVFLSLLVHDRQRHSDLQPPLPQHGVEAILS